MNKNTREIHGDPAAGEPKGDLGHGSKTWGPDQEDKGISNRPDDAPDGVRLGDEADDAAAFNGDEDDEDEDEDDDDDDDDDEDDDGDEPERVE